MLMMNGLKVSVDKHCTTQVWVYPKERFWEYVPSPETERWCRYFGFGHEETQPCYYIVGGHTLVIHPDLWAELCRRAEVVVEPGPDDLLHARPKGAFRVYNSVRDHAVGVCQPPKVREAPLPAHGSLLTETTPRPRWPGQERI